jgi:hypothetical protein
MRRRPDHVCSIPNNGHCLPDESCPFGANRKSGTLLDHFIRSGDQRRWHGNAERLGSLEIDDQLEPGGLLYR